MSSPRLAFAAVLLAIVVGATSLSFWVATQNFRIADPKRTPQTATVLAAANIEGEESRTMLSRYFASESNRAMFAFLGPLQVAGCAGAFLLAFGAARAARRAKAIRALLAGGFALSLALAPLVPMMVSKGRAIDFVSRAGGNPPEVRDFLLWHGLYMAGDALLFGAALALLPLLAAACGATSTAGPMGPTPSPTGDRA
jgi:hypothetical protein